MAKKEPQPDSRTSDVLAAFEESVGGREALHIALSYIKPVPKIEYIIGLIADPRNDTKSLAKICAMGGISIGELLDYYKESKGVKAQLAAMDAVYAETPKLAQEIVRDGLSKVVGCSRCDGAGEIKVGEKEKPCPNCLGEGKVIEKAPLDRVKLAAEIAGLTNKPAPQVQISATTNNTSNVANFLGAGDLKAFREASDKALYSLKATQALPKGEDVVDAEVEE